jgi:hypothetical protein
MTWLSDFGGLIFLALAGFALASVLSYLLRRNGWVWPSRLILLGLFLIGVFWTVQAFQADPDDWSGIGLIILVIFGVAPSWLGALLGADLGRRHHAKANPNLATPR